MWIHTFPNGICQKVNVIAWPGFELTYLKATVQNINHNTPSYLKELPNE